MSEKVLCECGTSVSATHLDQHRSGNAHKLAAAAREDQNDAQVLEQDQTPLLGDDDFDPDRDFKGAPGPLTPAHARLDSASARPAPQGEASGSERHRNEPTITDRDISDHSRSRQKITDVPPPFDVRGATNGVSAPIRNGPVMQTTNQTDNRRERMLNSEPDVALDEISTAVGTGLYRADYAPDWAKDPQPPYFHIAFRRYYYTAGVIIDSFLDNSPKYVQEAAKKCRLIAEYNFGESDPERRIGYLAHVVGVPLDYPKLYEAMALRKPIPGIIDRAIDPDYRAGFIRDMSGPALRQ